MNIKNILLSVMTLLAFSVNAQTIISVEFLNGYAKEDLNDLFDLPSFASASNGADEYRVIYNTTDIDGNPTVASGAMYLPWDCSNFPMGVYSHGTILNKNEVPSNGYENVGLAAAGFGYAVIAPDYLGLGVNNMNIHPYFHAESQATTAIDLLRGVRAFVTDSLNLTHNGELFLTGYSQGGHATMGLHKYIEDNNLLGEFNIIASAPLSGAYDLAGTQMLIDPTNYTTPNYLPYLIESMQLVYGNLYTSPSEVYLPPYDTMILSYQNGTISMETFGAGLSNNLYSFIQPTMLDAFLADSIEPYTDAFRIALAQNNNYDWTPQRPVRMVYCTGDEQVNPQSTLLAETTMNANGATDVETFLALENVTHSDCAYPAILSTLFWVESKKTPCFPVSTSWIDYSEAIAVYPNPTNGFIAVNLTALPTSKPLRCKIISMSGQVILEQTITGEMYPQLSLNNQPEGIYILTLSNEEVRVQRKVILF